MAELDKVINGLKCCTHAKAPIPCGDCSYFGNIEYNDAWSCRIAVMRDALELLKKDEVKPEIEKANYDIDSWHYVCGACKTPIDRIDLHCRGCGKTLKWDQLRNNRRS